MFIIGITIGILVVMYNRDIVRIVGTSGWAEKYLGAGGSYSMWQLIGLLIIVLTILYVTDTLDKVLGSTVGAIF